MATKRMLLSFLLSCTLSISMIGMPALAEAPNAEEVFFRSAPEAGSSEPSAHSQPETAVLCTLTPGCTLPEGHAEECRVPGNGEEQPACTLSLIHIFISQSLPQMTISAITLFVVFCIMMYYSVILALLVVAGVICMALSAKAITRRSSKFFLRQQVTLAKAEAFMEEMMTGQKVIKVFCHEEGAKAVSYTHLENQ